MTPEEIDIRQRLKDDFPHYAERCLKIRLKSANADGGKMAPFAFNKAQKYIHSCLETQKKECGSVRALLLKGKQNGRQIHIAAFRVQSLEPVRAGFLFGGGALWCQRRSGFQKT